MAGPDTQSGLFYTACTHALFDSMESKVPLQDYQKAYRMIRTKEERMAFAAHAISYVMFSVAFVVMNLIVTPDSIWFPFPLVGWGLIVVTHFLFVFKWLDKELVAKEKLAEKLAGNLPQDARKVRSSAATKERTKKNI